MRVGREGGVLPPFSNGNIFVLTTQKVKIIFVHFSNDLKNVKTQLGVGGKNNSER